MGGSRKRHHDHSSDEEAGEIMESNPEDQEEGELSDESFEAGKSESHRRKSSHDHKKSKKKKKDKKKKKKRRRRSSIGSASPSQSPQKRRKGEDDEASTDREGGLTPEVQPINVDASDDDGEEVAESDRESRRQHHEKKKKSHRHRSESRERAKERGADERRRHREGSDTNDAATGSRDQRGRHLPSKEVEGDKKEENSTGFMASLSVDETNSLRAKLGLKPLNVGSGSAKEPETDTNLEGTAIPNSDVRHKPAINLSEKSHIEKMREKLDLRRQKRMIEAKLFKVKTLGESDSDEDSAANWVKSQKKKLDDKKEAEKRAKALEELDDEFGIGLLVEEETKKEVSKKYSKSDLRGLKVEHSAERFREGREVILTLKDSGVLEDDANDTLVNVNIMDDERVETNLKNLREGKAGGYNPYEEEIDPLTGDLTSKGLLSKYDEEISGKQNKKSFKLGTGGHYDEEEAQHEERERIRQKLKKRFVETLEMPAPKVASDFLTAEESAVKFKKIKKKKVKRKMLKADDLLPINEEPVDNQAMDVDVDEKVADLAGVRVNDDENDVSLRRALARAKMLKRRAREEDLGAKIASEVAAAAARDEEESVGGTTGAEFIGTFADDIASNQNIILNETSEFCRHLGAWRANESTGMGEPVSSDLLEFESSLKESSQNHRGRWEEVKHDFSDEDDEDAPKKQRHVNAPRTTSSTFTILDEEPNLVKGLAGAIKMASTKGYFEAKEKEKKGSNLAHLQAKSYTIEDKIKDDERSSRRERYGGPTQTFTEKQGYAPNIKIDYVDDNGRALNSKEAFRHLSHRFHGKGSGKMKTEKRMKKMVEESMMRNMSSTDTPLQTLDKLIERQKEAATPYLILTGNKASLISKFEK